MNAHDGRGVYGIVILLSVIGCILYQVFWYEPPPLRVRSIPHYAEPLAHRAGEEAGKQANRFGKGFVKGWKSETKEPKEMD